LSVRLALDVKPGSKRTGFQRTAGGFVLHVRERAIDGAANEACIRAIAAALDLAPSNVELVRGARSRRKLFAIYAPWSEDDVFRRLGD
jgi:uncharacterized protein